MVAINPVPAAAAADVCFVSPAASERANARPGAHYPRTQGTFWWLVCPSGQSYGPTDAWGDSVVFGGIWCRTPYHRHRPVYALNNGPHKMSEKFTPTSRSQVVASRADVSL